MQLRFALLGAISFSFLWYAAGDAQAQAKLPGQYKRVHQNAFKTILGGKPDKAIESLNTFLDKKANDEESHYMLAVAYCSTGDLAKAAEHAERAVELGLPPGRIIGGTLTGLEPLRETEFFKELLAQHRKQPVHGPMIGDVTQTSAKIWVRTAGEAEVTVRISKNGGQELGQTTPVRTSKESDYTAVVSLARLEGGTTYHYQIIIDGEPTPSEANQNYSFTTLPTGKGTKFRLAFGGGAGYVPPNERAWTTIQKEKPDMLVLLGDNVYIDDPTSPAMQHYTYYRRQSRPEFRKLLASTPVYTIWDDHDFGTNDCSGGPAIDKPDWKRPVWSVYKNNWVNPGYGGGEKQPGCWYHFYRDDVHFIMLDGRYYRNLKPEDKGPDGKARSSMLGPAQREWLLERLTNSRGKLIVLCSPVPWVFGAKGNSKDTWNGFQDERNEIFDFLAENKIEGVVLMSADRHRSDLWKIERENGYPLYEFNSSRLTNQHVHGTMKAALFSYNKKQSFGTVDFDTTLDDPTITYRVVTIDGEEMHKHTLKRSELTH